MMRVYNHSASVIVVSQGIVDRVLLNEYDGTYRTEVFRRHFNFIGGNAENDGSPLETLKREVLEEMGSASPYANAILESAEAHGDYLLDVKRGPLKRGEDFSGVVSVYVARLDRELFESLEEDIRTGRQSSTEGVLRVVATEKLREGKPRGAWAYGKILGDVLAADFPEYEWAGAVLIGRKPKSSYREYKTEFEYQKDPEK